MATADFRDFPCIAYGAAGQGAEHIEAPLDPKVVRRGNF
jgi:hypothetical protein